MSVFHYTTSENGLTVEHLLRERWRAGKKTVHELRMAKGVKDMDGEPIDWRSPLPAGTRLTIEFPMHLPPMSRMMRSIWTSSMRMSIFLLL